MDPSFSRAVVPRRVSPSVDPDLPDLGGFAQAATVGSLSYVAVVYSGVIRDAAMAVIRNLQITILYGVQPSPSTVANALKEVDPTTSWGQKVIAVSAAVTAATAVAKLARNLLKAK